MIAMRTDILAETFVLTLFWASSVEVFNFTSSCRSTFETHYVCRQRLSAIDGNSRIGPTTPESLAGLPSLSPHPPQITIPQGRILNGLIVIIIIIILRDVGRKNHIAERTRLRPEGLRDTDIILTPV